MKYGLALEDAASIFFMAMEVSSVREKGHKLNVARL